MLILDVVSSTENKGIIICFDRLDEIKRFVDDCCIPENYFAVMVSDMSQEGKDLNGMGLTSVHADKALVLFTTKQQIILRSKGKDFKRTSVFYYMGEPRSVRIWDESLIVGKELALDRFSLLGLTEDISKTSQVTALKLEEIANELKNCNNGDVYLMPDLGLTLNEIMYSFEMVHKRQEKIPQKL